MQAAEMALFSVVRVEAFRYEPRARKTYQVAEATGFLYLSGEGELYLITNRHVVYDEARRHFPEKLRLHIRSDKHHLSKVKTIDLRLWSRDGKRLWKHSKSYPAADVVALRVPLDDIQGCFYFYFLSGDILGTPHSIPGREIDLGLQALVLGYPLGFYDAMNHLPMARMAGVATWPWLNYDKKPCFLIDSDLHPGMSGSPVISAPGTMRRDPVPEEQPDSGKDSYLLGVFSATWQQLGLNIVWHASIIRNMLDDPR